MRDFWKPDPLLLTLALCQLRTKVMLRYSTQNLKAFAYTRSAYRCLSVQHHQSQYVKQGGKLVVHLAPEANQSKITISSKWQETVDLQYDNDLLDVSFTEDADTNSIVVMSKQKSSSSGDLQITIPEYLDMDIEGYDVDLQMKNKVCIFLLYVD